MAFDAQSAMMVILGQFVSLTFQFSITDCQKRHYKMWAVMSKMEIGFIIL